MTENDVSTWHQANDAYLAAAVEWLRLLLARHVPPAPQPVVMGEQRSVPRTEASEESASWWSFRRTSSGNTPTPQAPTVRLLPAAPTEVTPEQLRAAEQAMRAAETSDPPPAMTLLARRAGLTSFERDLLLLCVAMELDTRIAALCARAQDDPSRPFPTFALAMACSTRPAGTRVSPERPLRYWRLIETSPAAGAAADHDGALRADERIVNYVKGLSHLDDRIAPFVMPLGEPVHDEDLPASQRAVVDAILRRAAARSAASPPAAAPRPRSGEQAARGARRRPSARPHAVSHFRGHAAGATHGPGDALPALAARDAAAARGALPRRARRRPECRGACRRRCNASWRAAAACCSSTRARRGRCHRARSPFDVEKPTPAEQREVWQSLLGEEHAGEAARLAGQFSLERRGDPQDRRAGAGGRRRGQAAARRALMDARRTAHAPAHRLTRAAHRRQGDAGTISSCPARRKSCCGRSPRT